MGIKAPLLATIIVGALGFGTFMTARQIERGVRARHGGGRHSGAKQALAALAEALGPAGSLVVWLGGTGACGAWLAVAVVKQKGRDKKKG